MSTLNWQQEIRKALSAVRELPCELSSVDGMPGDDRKIREAIREFGIKIPVHWQTKINWNDPDDPLLKQVLPDVEETGTDDGFVCDPTGDLPAAHGGVLRKYKDRALVVVTGACAIHCRYCFRRHFPYREHHLGHDLAAALDYIRQDPDIKEVILSGGDPLTLPNERLFLLWEQFERIEHVRRIRIHTRVPVVVPSRVDKALVRELNKRHRRYIVVLHINHAREIDETVCDALSGLRVTLLNQSVLLKGVNDDVRVLCELSTACFRAGILPYYLHMPDKTRGTAHFDVDEARAKTLHAGMRANLPGYLVPRLVREIPGADSKVPVA